MLRSPSVLSKIKGQKVKVEIEFSIPDGLLSAAGLSSEYLRDVLQAGEIDVKMLSETITPLPSKQEPREITLIIIGMPDSGKSSLGNEIVGREVFPSYLSGSSITRHVKTETIFRHRHVLRIVDTPGVAETGAFSDQMDLIEDLRIVFQAAKGEIVFIAASKVGKWRQNEQAVTFYKNFFGPAFVHSLIVVLTTAGLLHEEGMSVDEYIKSSKSLQLLASEVEMRVSAIDKRAPVNEKSQVVNSLLDMVVKLADNKTRPAITLDTMEKAIASFYHEQHMTKNNKEERQRKEQEAIEGIVRQDLEKRMTEVGERMRLAEAEERKMKETLVDEGGEMEGTSAVPSKRPRKNTGNTVDLG